MNRWNLLQSVDGQGQVVSVAVSQDRIFALVAKQAVHANQCWLVSTDKSGSNVQITSLPFAHPRSLHAAGDGTLLFLSGDALSRRQIAVRVSAAGSAIPIGDVSVYARSIWQDNDAVRIATLAGAVLQLSSGGSWIEVAPTIQQAPESGSAGCGACGRAFLVNQLPNNSLVQIDQKTGEIFVSAGRQWTGTSLAHEWIEDGRRDYSLLKKTATVRSPNGDSSKVGIFATVLASTMSDDGSLYLLVGPHDRRRHFRVLQTNSDQSHLTAVPCPTIGKEDRFNPVFISSLDSGQVAVADRFGEIRTYSATAREELGGY